jgi:hypothetical protein
VSRLDRFAHDLRSSTAVLTSAEWLVSENVREIRERQRAEYVIAVAPSRMMHLSETVGRIKR